MTYTNSDAREPICSARHERACLLLLVGWRIFQVEFLAGCALAPGLQPSHHQTLVDCAFCLDDSHSHMTNPSRGMTSGPVVTGHQHWSQLDRHAKGQQREQRQGDRAFAPQMLLRLGHKFLLAWLVVLGPKVTGLGVDTSQPKRASDRGPTRKVGSVEPCR